MKTKFKISVLALCLVLFVGIFSGFVCSGAVTWHDENDKNEYDAAMAELDEINKNKKDIEKQLKSLSSEKNNKIKRKTLLEQQLSATDTEIQTLEWVIEDLEVRLQEKTVELSEAEALYNDLLEKFKARARETYEEGNISYLEVIFSSDNFAELLSRMDIINDIMQNDKKNLDELRALKDKTESAKNDIETKKKAQEAALAQLETAKADLLSQQKALSASIKDLEQDEEALEAMEIEFEKAAKELDKQIEALVDKQRKYSGGDFMWPLPSNCTRITSPFGVERNFMLNGKRYHDVHSGVDIAASKGTPIYAAADGKIIYYKKDSTGSNTCAIDHGSSVVTKYYHMSAFAKGLSVGDEVKKGDVIGYVGMTGYATGNHLHFMVVINGKNCNPMDYVTTDGSKPKKTIN